MLYDACNCTNCDFTFSFIDISGRKCHLTAPVSIPMQTNVIEFAYRLIHDFDIPCYAQNVLIKNLEGFYAEKLAEWHRNNVKETVEALRNGKIDVETLANDWNQCFVEEHVEFAKAERITNEEVFSEMYHTLIHSPSLMTLLIQEHFYALSMASLVRNKDKELSELQAMQRMEMEEAVKGLGVTTNDEKVNALAVKQLEDIQMLESKRESEISSLRETQKRQFQDQVVRVHEEYHTSGTVFNQSRSVEDGDELEQRDPYTVSSYNLEESFTIHLGAQLKQMHNLRLLSAHVLNLCYVRPTRTWCGGRMRVLTIDSSATRLRKYPFFNVLPQRLQTAMSLYSNNLCGLVLLVDSRVNSYTGIKRDFARVCQSSTEFHFTGLEDQLEAVRDLLSKVSHWRNTTRITDEGRVVTSNGDAQSPKVSMLRPGDVYVTRHSNLAQVHVLFHVITDDSIRSGDISSRHPVILALRNVLKVACLCDITNVTMPLLLVHEMSEEMTMSWCLKRAELIYKCIKGFMIEMASWGGSESRTIQFLVPKASFSDSSCLSQGISDELFTNLSTMLPTIFRMSNPLKVKP